MLGEDSASEWCGGWGEVGGRPAVAICRCPRAHSPCTRRIGKIFGNKHVDSRREVSMCIGMRLGADILLMCPLHHSYRHNMELPCDKQELSVPSSLSDSFGAAGVQAPHSAPAPQRYRSKYRLVACHRDDVPAKANEMRVTYQGPVKSYMGYAMALFEERGARAVALKGMGRAIHKALAVAEILKRRVPGLHQRTEIGSLPFKEVWAPLEEGLNRVESTRYISSILITLSKDPPSLDIRSRPGYQPPLPLSEVRYPLGEYQRPYSRGGRNGGGRGRGGREGGRRGIGGGGGEAEKEEEGEKKRKEEEETSGITHLHTPYRRMNCSTNNSSSSSTSSRCKFRNISNFTTTTNTSSSNINSNCHHCHSHHRQCTCPLLL